MDGTQKTPVSGAATPADTPALTPRPQAVYDPPSLNEPSVRPASPVVEPPANVDTPVSAASTVNQPSVSAAESPSAAPAEPIPQPPRDATEEAGQDSGGFYKASAGDPMSDDAAADTASLLAERARSNETPPLEWTSNGETFQAHAGNWRARMIILTIVGSVLIFLLTRSYLTAIVILIVGVLFAVLGSKAPQPIRYRLDAHGILVGRKQFGYGEFRAFSVSRSTPIINLVPLKRFAPIMVLRYDPGMVDEIIQVLSAHLPIENVRNDAVDAFMNKLKI